MIDLRCAKEGPHQNVQAKKWGFFNEFIHIFFMKSSSQFFLEGKRYLN